MGGDDVRTRDEAGQRHNARLLVGTPYRYVAPLGRGGMGEVIEAEHAALGKRVVVKLLHAQFAERPDLVDRMRVEAQALARLLHPNLVVVNDFGQTSDGRTYMVMERLFGRTLRDELKARGALPPGEAIEWMRQVLAGLAAAHEAGIVHRDVKLENIFVCDPPPGVAAARTIKLLDFGIAKVIGGDGRAPAPLAFPTEEGISVGTPRFFSPEQAKGQRVDGRTDVYATGAVLYTIVAGRGPFDHISAIFELTRAHAMEKPAPPSRYARQNVPPALERAIMKALEKRPDDRFPSAAAFSAELERVAAAIDADPAPRELEARPTVRMPELADQQEAARRARQGVVAGGPAVAARGTFRLPDAPPLAGSVSPPAAAAAPLARANALDEERGHRPLPGAPRGAPSFLAPVVVISSALVAAAIVALTLMYLLR
jgi:eukaryotic-like serine/threonine-protein kinase